MKIGELSCEVIDFLNPELTEDLKKNCFGGKAGAKPALEIGTAEFWIAFPFDSPAYKNEYDDHILDLNEDWPEIKYPYHVPEEYMFNFDTGLFSSYERWDDEGDD